MRTGILATLATASLVAAAPLAKRNNTAPAKENIDAVVLNFALTLEHLEAAFYKKGLETFSADDFASADFPDWVRYRLSEISSHESAHVKFLTGALEAAGAKAAAACTYDFSLATSPAAFIAVAQQLEGVGVSAYAGAAKLITNPDYLTYAADVLAVEARHSAWIRGGAQNGDSFPQAFDTNLGINEVYTLAAQFIKECPSDNPALPVKAFPTLKASALSEDGKVTLSYDGDVSGKFALFLMATGQTAVAVGSDGSVAVPEGMYGQQYVILASSNATLSDDIVVAGPAIVEVPFQATEVPY
ncbi:ferritin-like domain-domain-containing protein [Leucosporidium creatinivorum]|uniref:Ferritin-like domain-domain-containing protein n=1 Tax=Leucosporidium creatinivorum TaxID=106004 RepID=A0A1Y2G549_9BASI|nr:ferritin-like domain-domain-containing protein [Leucosporidium creatinivorum]